MASSFSGFSIAKSGLFAQQQALNVISHNIANANTEGYSRQRVDMHTFRPQQLPGNYGSMGTGVDTGAVFNFRDEFLDFNYRGENEKLGEWNTRMDGMETIEAIFNEPSDTGVTTLMDEFYSSLHELNKNPESLTTRTLVRQRAIALVSGLNYTSESLKKFQSDIDFSIDVTTTQINGYAREITDLNRAIYNSELKGGEANDLRDQRNLLVDKLSELIDINYYEDTQDRFYIDVNGNSLVSHYTYDELVTVKRLDPDYEDDALYLHDVEWASGNTFATHGGQLKALIDLQGNDSGDYKGIPYYVEKLNEFTDTLINEINKVHQQGFGLDESSGTMLFTANGMTTAEYETQLLNFGLNDEAALDVTDSVLVGTSVTNTQQENDLIVTKNITDILANSEIYSNKSVKYIQGRYYITDRVKTTELSISQEVDLDLNKIAASSSYENIPGDGGNALRMVELRNNAEMFDWGSPDDFYKSLISNLGVDTQEAIRMTDNQENLVANVDTNRQSISGVSLDEEMAEMVKFQHAYTANARMITTLDEMIDLIVNRLGLVGR